jgi:SUF system NifU family Fe-S assembly protein
LEHFKHPRNKGLIQDGAYQTFRIKNPSCGDDITIQSKVTGDKIVDCRHEGVGCSICLASASVLTETMIGKDVPQAKTIADNYLKMVRNESYDESVDLEEAEVFAGVRVFPARIKCASIAWQAFLATLPDKGDAK